MVENTTENNVLVTGEANFSRQWHQSVVQFMSLFLGGTVVPTVHAFTGTCNSHTEA